MTHTTSEDMVKWMADTVHRAYHQDQLGTFISCPRDTCASAAKHLEALQARGTTETVSCEAILAACYRMSEALDRGFNERGAIRETLQLFGYRVQLGTQTQYSRDKQYEDGFRDGIDSLIGTEVKSRMRDSADYAEGFADGLDHSGSLANRSPINRQGNQTKQSMEIKKLSSEDNRMLWLSNKVFPETDEELETFRQMEATDWSEE